MELILRVTSRNTAIYASEAEPQGKRGGRHLGIKPGVACENLGVRDVELGLAPADVSPKTSLRDIIGRTKVRRYGVLGLVEQDRVCVFKIFSR
jgi:hypothetical protein